MKGCESCEFGWRAVSSNYPVTHYPMPDLTGLPDDLAAAAQAEVETRRAALTDSVYPCKQCQPHLFFRWAEGHLASKHDQDDCDECSEIRRGKRPQRRSAPTQGLPPARKDTDF